MQHFGNSETPQTGKMLIDMKKNHKGILLIAISAAFVALALTTGIFSGAGPLPIMLRFAFAAPIICLILDLAVRRKGGKHGKNNS